MDSACCRPVVVECNLWASCGEPPPLFVVERCSFALCFPLFLLSFFFEKMDRFVLRAWRVASSFFFSCLGLGLCLLLQSSFQLLFLLLGSLLYLDYSTRCQILVEPHSTTNLLRVSSPPFFCHRLFLYCCSNLVYKRMGIHSVCSLFSFCLLLRSREAFLFFLL